MMKKYEIAAFILAACLTFTSCSADNEDTVKDISTPEPTTQSTPSPTPDIAMIADANPSENQEPISVEVPDSGYYFDINEDEQAIYEKLKSELSTDVFEGVDPRSIAKIYVKAGIDLEWEAEYACFSPDYIGATKDEFHQMHLNDVAMYDPSTRQDVANWYFVFLDDAEFHEEGNRGYLTFHSVPDEEATEEDTYTEFHFIKSPKGIWEVRYNPMIIDYYED